MMILHLTNKLRLKLHLGELTATPACTGDHLRWYANMFRFGGKQYILTTNAATLYSVVTHGRGVTDLNSHLRSFLTALHEQLVDDGMPTAFMHSFLAQVTEVMAVKTADRSVLGSMNDMVNMCKFRLERMGDEPELLSDGINVTPFSAIAYQLPRDLFAKLLVDMVQSDPERPVEPAIPEPPRITTNSGNAKSGAKKTSGGAAGETVFRLKVSLKGSRPLIWRRVEVLSTTDLGTLHYVIQIAMGWTNSHLHEFTVGDRRYGAPEQDDIIFDNSPLDENTVTVGDVLRRKGARIDYEYDFGDGWEHEIRLEERLPADPGVRYPCCTGGEMACPPDDCGGLFGYYNMLNILKNPRHPDYEVWKSWIDPGFSPDSFNLAAVNRELGRIKRWRKLGEMW